MAGRTLYDKIWESHSVGILPTGQTQLFIGLHLIHEITTAPAFDMLREKGMDVAFRNALLRRSITSCLPIFAPDRFLIPRPKN